MPSNHLLTDLPTRSRAVRKNRRQSVERPSAHDQTLIETLHQSTEQTDRAETRIATVPMPATSAVALELELLPPLDSKRTRARVADLVAYSRKIRVRSREVRIEAGRLRQGFE